MAIKFGKVSASYLKLIRKKCNSKIKEEDNCLISQSLINQAVSRTVQAKPGSFNPSLVARLSEDVLDELFHLRSVVGVCLLPLPHIQLTWQN